MFPAKAAALRKTLDTLFPLFIYFNLAPSQQRNQLERACAAVTYGIYLHLLVTLGVRRLNMSYRSAKYKRVLLVVTTGDRRSLIQEVFRMQRRGESKGIDPMRRGGGAFRTTRWSIVCAAGNRRNPQSRAALEELCAIYWQPLYIYARHRGRQHHDAADATQEFITKLIEENKLGRADRLRGKFRTFLLKAFDHFLINEWKKVHAIKRGNGVPDLPIHDPARVPPDDPSLCQGLSAQRAYDLKWRATLMEQAIVRLGKSLTDAVDRAIFQALELRRADNGKYVPKYAELAQKMGISEQNVKTRMYRMRARLGTLIRDEIRHTVSSESEVEEELRDLMSPASGL